MYLYYDTPEQWNYAYDKTLDCKQKVSVFEGENKENNQVLVLTDKNVTEWYKEAHESALVLFACMT